MDDCGGFDLSRWKNGVTNHRLKWEGLQVEQVWGWDGKDPEFSIERVEARVSRRP